MKTRIHLIATILLIVNCQLSIINCLAQPGSLDNTFGTGGKVTTAIGISFDGATSLAIQSDGKMVLAGYSLISTHYQFALVRYNNDGTLDNTFGSGGKVTTAIGNFDDRGNSVAIQADGKILLAGQSFDQNSPVSNDFAIARYNIDGSMDNTFGSSGKVITDFDSTNDYGNSILIQPDGKILLAGQSVGNNWDFAIARYNDNGTLDNTFGTGGKVKLDFNPGGYSYDYGNSVALQPNGKILVAGSNYDSVHFFAIVRYNSNGTLDNNFGSGGKVCTDFGGSDLEGRAVAIQADNKIVMVGWSNVGVYQAFALARFDTIGNLDSSFGTGGKVTTVVGTANAGAYSVAIQPDGKIILAGHSYNNYDDFTVVRYNADGTLDNPFGSSGKVVTNFGNSDDGAFSVALQGDGKIVLAGMSNNGTNFDFAAARYNVITTTTIVENNSEKGFNLYPNPFRNSTTIECSDARFTNGDIIIYDVVGRVVQKQILNSKHETLNLDLRDGVYFYKISNEKKEIVGNGKLIIQ